jgi:SNF2 family DNA or RNA helicase
MCGAVSFKRGEEFFRTNKVTFSLFDPNRFEATVSGGEDFHVSVEVDEKGRCHTKCSCPTLSSYQKECQHIAAVLLAIADHQRQSIAPYHENSGKHNLNDDLLSLFEPRITRSSRQQSRFEKRQILNLEFICKAVEVKKSEYAFAIEIKANSTSVKDLYEFLKNIKQGKPYKISSYFTYEPSLHCFAQETDAVLQQLIEVIEDEASLFSQGEKSLYPHVLIIQPSSWKRLHPLLEKVSTARLQEDQQDMKQLQFIEGPLPLQFELGTTERNHYHLKISGLQELIILNSYSSIITNGKIAQMEEEDCQRLSQLKKMVEVSGTNQIQIFEEQTDFFLEKVVPGLKRLGEVKIDKTLIKPLMKTPLVAKLYLDRVNNHLLAGLEFHYSHFVFNPLENRQLQTVSNILRDVDKEDEILRLMSEAMFATTEEGYFLQNEELEYDFLTYIVPKLEKHVQIYATTAVRNRIFRGSARPQIRVKLNKDRINWLEFKFEMEGISDQQIKDILLALEEKRKYYRLKSGSLLSLETREFAELKRFLNQVPAQSEEPVFRVPLVQGIHLLDTVEDRTIFKGEQSFQQFLETLQNPAQMTFTIPPKLEPVLRDYQKHGFKWMKTLASFGFGGILADDMGLGKTLQSIAFIQSERDEIRKKKHPVLIVCPASLTYNWRSEIMNFTPDITSLIVDGTQENRAKLLQQATEFDVVITSYPLLLRDVHLYARISFHTVFFDEAQVFKNPLTQTAKAVKKITARYRFALTGTPVENSIEELWSIFHVVFPELFQGLKEYSHLTRKSIVRRSRPFILRRVKEDVLLELPKKVESLETVDLLPEQKKLYAAYLSKLREETLKHLDKDTLRKNRIKILAGLTRLRQICCHPALFVEGYKGASAKFEQLMQILEEARLAGRRVLIFSQFTKMLDLIGRKIAKEGQDFFYLDGQTAAEERVKMCKQFNEGEHDLFLISLKAGGTGLNLTGADTVILYDLWWNPAVEAQAMDRAHRIGQTNTVQVIKLIARGTIEEKINELQEKKRDLISSIIDPEDHSGYALTEEDIREILSI